MSNKVAVVKVDTTKLNSCVQEAISLIGGISLEAKAKVVIKPNLCTARKSSDDGVTTDVRVVEAVVDYLRKRIRGCEIAIVESKGAESHSAETAFKRHGYNELAEKYGVNLCDLNKEPTVRKDFPQNVILKNLNVPKILASMDYFISIAKMKRHYFERYTGIWKNQYGCIPLKKFRNRFHPFLSEMLLDINRIFPPNLGIVDGITALEGPGPFEGEPKKMNLIISSKNPLSADIVTIKIMGEKPRSVPHIKYALTHGFERAEKITLMGETDISVVSGKAFQFMNPVRYWRWRVSLYLQKLRGYKAID